MVGAALSEARGGRTGMEKFGVGRLPATQMKDLETDVDHILYKT
jgi:hypothetical protein